jgi:hypothetical protein
LRENYIMIDVNDVMKSYTGKTGCWGGSRGVYKVASKYLAQANESRGYDYQAEDVSDRSVKMAVNKLNKLIDWNDADAVAEHVNEDHAYFDDFSNGRTICVYFV